MKKCILILGMHRSGTSALAGSLATVGLNIGKNLISPSKFNLKGYFENKDFLNFNQNILLPGLNSNWDSLGDFPNNWENKKIFDSYYLRARELIKKLYSGNSEVVLKDPRLCILFPFWEKVFNSLSINIEIVYIIRKQEHVAQSLERRNNFQFNKSLGLWLKYNLFAEHYSRNYNRVIVSYRQLLNDPIHTINFILNKLDLNSFIRDDNKDKLKLFVDNSLNHVVKTEKHQYPKWIKNIVETITKLPKKADERNINKLINAKIKFDIYANIFNDGSDTYKANNKLIKQLCNLHD